ncbi:putative vacuolar iron transporter protein [Podospora fimiseda]|uniref:Vacuolar iron transporter protein n=1 Tax=Podospora fimiseda TaxID=252190 RepID=A0AAN7BLY5_9PEZI|nr:putative vacuolar iron transporter protein [Podospora fimiseda]
MSTLNHHLSRIFGRGVPPTSPPHSLPLYESLPLDNRKSSSDDSTSDTHYSAPLSSSSTSCPSSSSTPTISLPTFLSNLTLGFADGLTVPFALTAGLSSLGNTKTVIYAGMAEICAGSISMGIGGNLAAKSGEHQSSDSPSPSLAQSPTTTSGLSSEEHLLQDEEEKSSLADYKIQIMGLDLPAQIKDQILCHLNGNFVMEEKECPVLLGLSVSLGYLLGGIIPLFPYFFLGENDDPVSKGLTWSFGVCVVALFVFGFGKGWMLGWGGKISSSKRMVLLGSLAAGAAVLCVRAFEGLS